MCSSAHRPAASMPIGPPRRWFAHWLWACCACLCRPGFAAFGGTTVMVVRRPGGQGRASTDLGPRDPCTEQYNNPDVICILPPRGRLCRCMRVSVCAGCEHAWRSMGWLEEERDGKGEMRGRGQRGRAAEVSPPLPRKRSSKQSINKLGGGQSWLPSTLP